MSTGKRSFRKFEPISNFLASRGFQVGFLLYLLSFFLPAVLWATGPMPGWLCAWMSLLVWATEGLRDQSFVVPMFAGSVLGFFGGLINPLAILYAVLRGRDAAVKLRTSLCTTILWCIPFSWLCMLVLKMQVRVGHIAWIAGLLLMVFSEAAVQHDFRFTRYSSVFCLLVLCWCGGHWVITPTLAPITDRDEFFFSVAVHFKAPQACSKIGRDDDGGFSQQTGYQIAYLRSRCFYDLAQITKDLGLCKHVRPLNNGNQDGRRYSPEGCREQVSDPIPPVSAYLERENFVKLMDSAGFEGVAMAFRRERYRNDAAFLDLYERARQDATFVSALQRMPERTLYENINWRQWPRNPPVAEEPRPATGAEYLLAMVGMDQTDGKLCNKIAFAARYQYPDGKTVSLRDVCILHVGFYGRKYEVCGPGYGPKICQDSLQTDQYPDIGEPVYDSPAFFPDRESFQAALKVVGYSPTISGSILPKPIYDDYIELFYHTAKEGTPADQADFVRRVMSIK
jgi:hypothetical protein